MLRNRRLRLFSLCLVLTLGAPALTSCRELRALSGATPTVGPEVSPLPSMPAGAQQNGYSLEDSWTSFIGFSLETHVLETELGDRGRLGAMNQAFLPPGTTWRGVQAHLASAASATWAAQAPPQRSACDTVRAELISGHDPDDRSERRLLLYRLSAVGDWVEDGRCTLHWQVYRPAVHPVQERLLVRFYERSPGAAPDAGTPRRPLLIYTKLGHYAP